MQAQVASTQPESLKHPTTRPHNHHPPGSSSSTSARRSSTGGCGYSRMLSFTQRITYLRAM